MSNRTASISSSHSDVITYYQERNRNMKKLRIKTSLLVSASAVAGLAMGAGIAMATHPPIQLYTYEEIAQQMGFPAAPVIVDATKKMGLPYSPKQTCGLGGCHDGATVQVSNANQ